MQIKLSLGPGIKIILIGAVANLGLSIIKFAGGILGNSAAMIADAVHSLSDLLTDGIVLCTYKIGQLPRDENHPYGHGRAETIGATVVGIVIVFAGLGLAFEAVELVTSGPKNVPKNLAVIAAVLSILINEVLFRYTRSIGEKLHSPSLIANAWHHRSDAISSIAALLGIAGAMMGYPVLDPVAGGIVAIMVVRVGYEITRQGVIDLMDTSLDEQELRKIEKQIENIPGVVHSHELRTRRIGGEVLMDVHILVDRDLTVTEGHNIAEKVRRHLIKAHGNVQDVLVHVDTEDDTQVESLYQASREELNLLAEPILSSTQGVLEKTNLRIHFHKRKTILEVYVRMAHGLTLEESKNIIHRLQDRLQALDPVDEAKVFVDVHPNHKS